MNNDQNHNRGNFIKHPSIKTKKVNEYDLLNPCYSDSQPLSKMPMNKNNSAIVICSNDEEDKSEGISKLSTSRNNFKNGLSHKRDNTPKRNMSKLLHSNSSCRSVSNGRKMRSKKDQRSKISKKKMKLKNIMESDTVKNHYRKLKQPKFADIGMNLLTKKKNQPNTNQHQNSELIELTNDISGIGKENIHSNINISTTKFFPNHGKSKKSFSKIKSNHFSKNLGHEMRNCASHYNLKKQSSRKRRNATVGSKNKSMNKSYYSHREKETSKRKANPAQITTEIEEEELRKSGMKTSNSKRH